MNTRRRANPTLRDRVSRQLMRGLWLGLTAVHAPILIRLTAEVVTGTVAPERIATWLGLVAATGVFAFLAYRGFARCLGTPGQNLLLLCLVTALVHRGAIGFGSGDPIWPVAVVATSGLVGGRLWRPGRRLLRSLRLTLAATARRLPLGAFVDRLRLDARPARRLHLTSVGGPRAPPGAAVPA